MPVLDERRPERMPACCCEVKFEFCFVFIVDLLRLSFIPSSFIFIPFLSFFINLLILVAFASSTCSIIGSDKFGGARTMFSADS